MRAMRSRPSSSSGSVCVCSSATICRRVLDAAQEPVRPRSVRRAPRRRSSRRSASAPSISTVSRPRSAGIAAAGDQLLRLDEELDLADAAAAELDVVARRPRSSPWPLWAWIWRLIEWMSAMAAKSRYLRQMIGRSSARKASPAAMSPATGARLDHGRAFPVLAAALVVVERRLDRDRERRRAGIGPQAQVGAEDVAVARCAPAGCAPAAASAGRRARSLRRVGEAGASGSKKTIRSMSEE